MKPLETCCAVIGIALAAIVAVGQVTTSQYDNLRAQRDRAAMATRFVIPLVVNGRVYFGARGEVEVYGLLK
jgi:hypothetical protein